MNYGYARVSTTEQHPERQLDALKEKGIDNIFVDKYTGISFDRPNYQRLRRRLKRGDVLFVKSLDRLGRKYTLVLDEWRYLAKKGVAVVVLDMPILDTRNKDGNLMGRFIADLVLQVLSFVAESEYKNIHERQRQGIEAAKARGVRFGKPALPIPDNFIEFATRYANGELTIKKAAEECGMSKTKFYVTANRYLQDNKIKILPFEERSYYKKQVKRRGERKGKPLPPELEEYAKKCFSGEIQIKEAAVDLGMKYSTFWAKYHQWLIYCGYEKPRIKTERPIKCSAIGKVPSKRDCLDCPFEKCVLEDKEDEDDDEV